MKPPDSHPRPTIYRPTATPTLPAVYLPRASLLADVRRVLAADMRNERSRA